MQGTSAIMAIGVAIVLTIILFTVVQDVFLGSDTTGWSTLQITLAGTLGTVMLIGAVVLVFRLLTGGKS